MIKFVIQILALVACLEAVKFTNVRRKFIPKYNVANSDSKFKGLCGNFSYLTQSVSSIQPNSFSASLKC